MTRRTWNAAFAVLLNALVFGAIQGARADVCCPSGCVPLYNGTAACVKAGTNLSCGSGAICGGGGGSPSAGNGQPGTYVVPIIPPSACGLWLQCSYANGVATVSIVNSSGTRYKNPPKEWVYTRVVYAKGCVGGGAALSIPVDGSKATLNLLKLQYHNLCTNELPMSFLARIGSFPEFGRKLRLQDRASRASVRTCFLQAGLRLAERFRRGYCLRDARPAHPGPERERERRIDPRRRGAPTRARMASSGARRGPPTLCASRPRVARK